MSEATEVVADVIEEVGMETARAVRSVPLHMSLLGATMTFAGGCLIGYALSVRKLTAKYNQIAEDEIAVMREHYQAKTLAMENTVEKPKLQDLVMEKGYTTEQPVGVQPPEAVMDAAKDLADEQPKSKPPVPLTAAHPDDNTTENIFAKDAPTEEDVGMPLVNYEWDEHKEKSRRSPLRPYVIHRDERKEMEDAGYDEVTLTYYEEDDVVCNEADEVLDREDRERTIGEENLNRFGHGSGDASIVYIRNNQLECDFEVVRSPNSFVEEVHGFEPEPPELKHEHTRRRRHFDDE